MDGTGELFLPLLDALPADVPAWVARYPTDVPMGYDALLDWLDAHRPEGPHVVVGESFSGPLAVRHAARRHPDTRGLVFISSFVRSPVPRWVTGLGATLGDAEPVPSPAGVRALLTGPAGSDALIEAVRSATAQATREVSRSRLQSIATVDVRQDLARVTAPVGYVKARWDVLVRGNALRDVRRIRPDTRVLTVSTAHLAAQLAPAEVAAFLVGFARR